VVVDRRVTSPTGDDLLGETYDRLGHALRDGDQEAADQATRLIIAIRRRDG
jgi:hypothetical protein